MFDFVKRYLDSVEFDFVQYRKGFAVLSVILVALAWGIFGGIGPKWGIDFTGGTELQLKFCAEEGAPNPKELALCGQDESPVDIADLRGALASLGVGEDAVQRVGGPEDQEYMIRIQDPTFGAADLVEDVEKRLKGAYGDPWWKEGHVEAEVGVRIVITYDGPIVLAGDAAKHLDGMTGVKVHEGKEERQLVVTLPGLSTQIQKEISDALGGRQFTVLASDAVGPKVGGDLRRQGFISVAITLGLVLIYIAFRFDLAFAPGAVLALVHDVSLVLGVFVLMQKELNLPFIGALLTTVGYSLNDTIVIYDRIRENRDRYRRKNLQELINVSINETLARTLATSLTTMLALLAFLFMGGSVIQDFALAMVLGVIFGTYSTVYVASPMILVMQDVKPRLMKLLAIQGGEDEAPEPGEPGEEEAEPEALTESEKRRRERAQLEQRKSGPSA